MAAVVPVRDEYTEVINLLDGQRREAGINVERFGDSLKLKCHFEAAQSELALAMSMAKGVKRTGTVDTVANAAVCLVRAMAPGVDIGDGEGQQVSNDAVLGRRRALLSQMLTALAIGFDGLDADLRDPYPDAD